MGRAHYWLRLVAVLGLWAAAALAMPGAEAHHSVHLTECSSGEETPEPESPGAPDAPPDPDATPSPSPTPQPPGPPGGQNCVPRSGSVLAGTHTLHFAVQASSLRPIKGVQARLLSQDEEAVPHPAEGEPILSETYQNRDEAPEARGYFVDWDTSELTPYNGAYAFEVTAWAYDLVAGDDLHPETARREDLLVNTRPVTPSRPRIVVAAENSVTVEWDRAPEPDVLGYTLYRATTTNASKEPKAEDFEPLQTTTKTAVRDLVPGPGAYWYKVKVTRRSVVTPDDGISSRISQASSAGLVAGLHATPRPEDAPPPPPPRAPIVIPRASASRPPPVPEAPFSAYLPFDAPESRAAPPMERDRAEPGEDPRTGVLPVAVGAFLLSSAMAIGRMPY